MIESMLSILTVLLVLCIIPTIWIVYKKRITFFNGVFLGTFLFLMSFCCSVWGLHLLNGYSPIDAFINDTFNSMKEAYNLVGDNQAMMLKLLEVVKETYIILVPSMVVLTSLSISYLLFMLSKGILALCGKDVSAFRKFCDLKMPKIALFLAAISFIVTFFTGDSPLGYAFTNFSSIIFSVTTICGISVVDFKLRKKIRISVLRFIIYIFLIVVLTLLFRDGTGIFMLIGMIDSAFDFRRTKINSDEEEKK